VTLGNDR